MNFRHGEGGQIGGIMKLTKITAIAGGAAVLGFGLGACGSVTGGSAASHSSASAPAKVVNYKAQYLSDVALSNALVGTISNHDGWTSRPVTAYSNALVTESRTMLHQSWPVSVRGDIHAITLAALKVHDDILSKDSSGFQTDLTTAGAESNIVRAEFGLPAVKAPNVKPAPHRPHATASPAPPAAPAPAAPAPAAPAGLSPVGIGTQGEEVYANSPITSTAFALNVESDYWNSPGMQFTSYSPVTGQDYSMSAVDSGGEVTVTNGLGCEIQFSDGS